MFVDICQAWRTLDDTTRAGLEGLLLMMAFQAYKAYSEAVERHGGWLAKITPPLHRARGWVKIVLVAAFSGLWATGGAPCGTPDWWHDFFVRFSAAIVGHNLLTFFVNEPAAELRAARNKEGANVERIG